MADDVKVAILHFLKKIGLFPPVKLLKALLVMSLRHAGHRNASRLCAGTVRVHENKHTNLRSFA